MFILRYQGTELTEVDALSSTIDEPLATRGEEGTELAVPNGPLRGDC